MDKSKSARWFAAFKAFCESAAEKVSRLPISEQQIEMRSIRARREYKAPAHAGEKGFG